MATMAGIFKKKKSKCGIARVVRPTNSRTCSSAWLARPRNSLGFGENFS